MCVILIQDSDDYTLVHPVRESPAVSASHKAEVHDGDSSGQSDTEEMSDILKKDPIISKYSKYRITKKTSQQKSSRKFSLGHLSVSL